MAETREQLLQELERARTRITELESDLSKTQSSLHLLEQNHKKYLELSRVILVSLDNDDQITAISGNCFDLTGYQPDELIGKNWFQVCLPEENYEQVYAVYKKLISGDINNVEYYENEILTKSGERKYFAWHNSVTTDLSGKIVGTLSSGVDITYRKLNESHLRDSEMILNKVQEIAHIGSWNWDTINNTAILSPELYKIYGLSPEEFDGNIASLSTVIHPDDWEKVMKSQERTVKEGRPQQTEFRLVRQDGSIRHVWGAGTNTFNDKGVIVRTIGIVQDITERKKIEEELRNSEAHFRNIIDASPVPFALNDEQQNITYLNPAFVKTFGYIISDIPTLADWWPKAYPDEKYRQWVSKSWQERLEKSKQSGLPFEPLELEIQCADGSKKTVLAGASALTDLYKGNHLVTLYDVSDRKAAELAYCESESRYRMIVETSREGIWTIDTNNNTSFVNPVMANMLGYSVDEMQGRPLFDFMDDEGRQISTDNIERRKAGISEQHDFKFLHKDGNAVWVELNTSPLLDADDVYLGALAMVTDVTERRRAEQALRNTQDLLLRTESLAQVGSWKWDLATNKVQWSPEMYRIYKYDPIDYSEINFSLAMERVHPEDVKKIEGYVRNLLETGNISSIEYRIVLPDESIRYLWSECEVINKGNSPKSHMVGFVQDITDRILAEEALREGNKRFRLLFDQSSFGVAKIDSRSGRFIEINQRYCDMLDYSLEEMLAMDFKMLTFAEDLPADLDNMSKLKSGEISSFQMEKRYLNKEGSILWVNLSVVPLWEKGNTPDFHLAIVEDITKRKRAEETLQRQKEEQYQLINNIADAVIVIDEQGLVQTFSKSAEHMFGYSSKEIVGQSINNLMPDSEAKLHNKSIAEYLASDTAHIIDVPRDVNAIRKSGEIFPIRLSIAELPRSVEGVRRFIGVGHDMTFEKQQDEQLRRSQKMDALGKLTGGIAHDYNNMLGVVLGYAQLLKDALSDDAELSQYVYEIQHASQRGSILSRKLLGFSRNAQPQADCLDVNEMLLAERDMLQKTLTPRIDLVYDLVENPWLIFVNSGEFEDAILNLCINAMQAMESGGKLILRTSNQTLSNKEASKFKLSGGEYLLLTVCDTGAGIDRDNLNYIFDPFFTTKDEGGIGLGLSMVYGFVQRSAGAIAVNSEKERGSEFMLYFPRYIQLSSIPVKPETISYSQDKLRGNEVILVVDDELAMVNLCKEILSAKGYRVLTANCAIDALALLKKNAVDLLLSDVIMSGMDGYQLAAKAREMISSINILLVSGYTDNRQVENVGSKFEETLLQKPFTPETLLVNVRKKLDESQASAKLPTILVMDDDENIQKLFEINLKKLNYEVVFANDGSDAIAIYRDSFENNQTIDVVVLDISVPGGMGGKETAEKILALDPNAKLVVSSGDAYGHEMTNYQEYGFKAMLEKDFDREKMQKIFSQVLMLA